VRLRLRGPAVPADVRRRAAVPRGDRVLAFAAARDGSWLLGTRSALQIVPAAGEVVVLPWETVEDAAWDSDGERLRVVAMGEYGRPKPSYSFEMEEPGLLLQLVRERVTASVLLQRRVPVRGRRGFSLVARRSPTTGEIRWFQVYDAGVDPEDPQVVAAAEEALTLGRAEVGEQAGR
jgi:hypothetical protein